MRRVTPEIMATDPVGSFVCGEGYVHFCARPTLWGMILWGRPDLTIARELGKTLPLELGPPAVPHTSVVDASRLEGADSGAFEALDWYTRQHGEALAAQVMLLALVRPPGLSGAIVSGVFDVVHRPYPVEVFGTLGEALARCEAADTHDDLLDAYARASGTPALLSALRAVVDANLTALTVGRAARALGLSERSLQRKLSDLDTTFKAEVGAARVRAAQRLLVDTTTPLTKVAFEVGCASLQHFSSLFRKHVGESPSAWRKRHRRP